MSSKSKRVLLFASALSLLIPLKLSADDNVASKFILKLGGNVALNGAVPQSGTHLNFKAFGGNYSYRLYRSEITVGTASEGAFYRAKSTRKRDRVNGTNDAAVDVLGGTLRVLARTRRSGRPFRVEAKLNNSGELKGHLYVSPSAPQATCATKDHPAPIAGPTARRLNTKDNRLSQPRLNTKDNRLGQPPTLPNFLIDILVDADYVKAVKKVTDSNSKAAKRVRQESLAVLNAANAFYADQIGIEFRVSNLQIYQGKAPLFSSANSEDVLKEFQQLYLSSSRDIYADTHYLFSGIRFREFVLGIAYFGVLCQDNSMSFGAVGRSNPALRAVVTAHELGHNLGATHVAGENSVMSAEVGPKNTVFAPQSLQEILDYYFAFGSCIFL